VVRSAVEETLNEMLDDEADRLCRAERYERTEARKDTRAGSYRRQLHTKVGEVSLKFPSCARYRSRPRSSNGTGGVKGRWKKLWCRCILPE
jgi:transposase-like protein